MEPLPNHSMINNIARSAFLTIAMVGGFSLLTSCSVDQEAAFNASGGAAKTKKSTVKTDTESTSWQEKMDAAKAEREERRAEAEKTKAKELAAKEAAKKKELAAKEAAKKSELAAKEKAEKTEAARKQAEEARKKEIAAREKREKEKSELAEEKAREAEFAAKRKAKENEKAAKIAAREKVERDREARKKAEEARELAEAGTRRERRPLFGGGGSSKYRSAGQDIYVNKKLIGSLSPANAKIEIDISEQKARVFRSIDGHKHLVIETNVSTGKSGHATSPGSFRIQEKLVAKRSTRYGRWLNSSGATIQSDGDSYRRPSGASRFVGASMPYWMRVNGGIGMHIGYVPNYPASHGCIRVPAEIQPLIFSKVGVGTSVTIRH